MQKGREGMTAVSSLPFFYEIFLSVWMTKACHAAMDYRVMEMAVSASMASQSGFLAGAKVHWRRERSI